MKLCREIIFIGPLLLSACGVATPSLPRSGLPDTGQPALHAITDARLRQLMDQMNSLMFERFMTEPEIDRERRSYALRMAQTAGEFGAAVDGMFARLPELKLTPDEQTAFRALAGKLRDHAHTLEWQANHNRIDALPATLEQMRATCSSCHALFRKL